MSRILPRRHELTRLAVIVRRDPAVYGLWQSDENVATIVENERWRAKVGGRDELSPFDLRVSTTYRREGGDWKVALRHADPIATPRAQGPIAS